MTDKIAIFLTVLASSCLGMYFYYNEQNVYEDDLKDVTDDENENNEHIEEESTHEKDIYFGKKIYNQIQTKSKRNKKSKRQVSSRKTYYK
jgi:hypothetical protein